MSLPVAYADHLAPYHPPGLAGDRADVLLWDQAHPSTYPAEDVARQPGQGQE